MADLRLDTLESKGLIRVATLQPELEYLFRHALVQDAAYESLLKQERRALHRLVGDALEQLYPERHGELAAVLARHFEQAGEAEKAIGYLVEAARFAYDRNALVESYELYGRAAALLPPASATDDDATSRQRLEIEFGRLKTGFSFLSEDVVFEMIKPLNAAADRLGDPRLAADIHLHGALLRMYRGERYDTSPELRHSLDRVSEIAAELDDPLIAALPTSIIGLFQVFTGDLRAGVESLRSAAPLLEQKHDFVGSSFALVALAIGLARLGRFAEAEDAARSASEVGESGDLIARLDALIGEAQVRSIRGDLDGAVPLAQRCASLGEETGATACVVASSFVLGDALMRQGRFGDARIAFERGASIADVTEQKIFRPSISAYLRATEASLGEFDTSTRSFEEALDEARSVGDRWGETQVIWKRAETEAKRTDADREQMLSDYAAAAAAFDEMGARPYLARVLRDWGGTLRAVGQSAEGDQKLRRAIALFDELGIEREADALRAILELNEAPSPGQV
jgi:tetratricopeptide (TPR) repeat protein